MSRDAKWQLQITWPRYHEVWAGRLSGLHLSFLPELLDFVTCLRRTSADKVSRPRKPSVSLRPKDVSLKCTRGYAGHGLTVINNKNKEKKK